MKVDFYFYRGEAISVLVSDDEGNKFIENVTEFCKDWTILIEEAKEGFPSFSFYDQYKNNDVSFFEEYSDIINGENEDYEWFGCINDGYIEFEPEDLENKGEYFAPLLYALKISRAYNYDDEPNNIFIKDNYILFSSDRSFMICSNTKVPFEPNEAQKEIKQVIKKNVSKLNIPENFVFTAEYGTSESKVTDIENALFYNIGNKTFKEKVRENTALYIKRIPSNKIGGSYKYVYNYSSFEQSYSNTKRLWEKPVISEWTDIPLGVINSNTKPTDYFLALKKNNAKIKCHSKGYGGQFGLNIKLKIPRSARYSGIINIMKPMIDGIICAFHFPKGIDLDLICKISKISKELLESCEIACLDERRYVLPYNKNKSIKWDPSDDKLQEIFIEPTYIDGDEFYFSGQLFSI